MSTTTTSPHLANRFEGVGFSEIVQIRNKITALQAQGKKIFPFHGGEPVPNTPQYIKDAMIRALADNKTRYAASSGEPPLLDAIIKKVNSVNKIPAQSGHVQVVNGGMHALCCAFHAVLNPGDELLIFSPYWTPIRDLTRLTEAKMVLINTQAARRDGMKDSLRRYLTPRTKALYFNSPLNPTGEVFTRQEIQEIADFAQEAGLTVIADEAYEDLIFEGEHISIASLAGMHERTLSCFTLSKTYSMTGWRVGYVTGTEPLMTGIRAFALYSINGVSTPTQWAALAALTETPPNYLAELRATYRERRDLLADGLASLGFECSRPPGAFYLFPNASAFGSDSWEICNMLIERAGVSSVPGVVFGPEGEAHLRLSFSTTRENIEGALDSLRKNL